MPTIFDYDDGNGVYDVETRADHERWEQEYLREQRRLRLEQASPEEREDPLFDVPY